MLQVEARPRVTLDGTGEGQARRPPAPPRGSPLGPILCGATSFPGSESYDFLLNLFNT